MRERCGDYINYNYAKSILHNLYLVLPTEYQQAIDNLSNGRPLNFLAPLFVKNDYYVEVLVQYIIGSEESFEGDNAKYWTDAVETLEANFESISKFEKENTSSEYSIPEALRHNILY